MTQALHWRAGEASKSFFLEWGSLYSREWSVHVELSFQAMHLPIGPLKSCKRIFGSYILKPSSKVSLFMVPSFRTIFLLTPGLRFISLHDGNFLVRWMNERTNERTNEWMNEWMNERMNDWMNEWMIEWTNERTNEWTNEWLNEYADKKSSGWMMHASDVTSVTTS